ncbi:MAG: transporter [Deltaproteobacteria bacterium]|nr:transporter [Deltaproteobacteria bacterium]
MEPTRTGREGGVRGALALTAFVLVTWHGTALGSHVSLGAGAGEAGGPITTVPASGLERGQWVTDLGVDYLRFDTFSQDRLLRFAAADREVHNVASVTTYTAGFSLGLAEGIGVHLGLPYVFRDDVVESEPPDEVHRHGDASGFGDASVHFHHRLVHFVEHDLRLALLYGLKVPTGDTSEKDADGTRFEAEFQPGSGSWDPFLGLSASAGPGPLSVHGNVTYTLVTEGTQDTDLGDRLSANLAAVYRLSAPVAVDLVLEANGLWQAKEKAHGEKDPDSGGRVLLLSPGIRAIFGQWLAAYGSLGVPVFQDLNGDQNELDYRLTAGVNASF